MLLICGIPIVLNVLYIVMRKEKAFQRLGMNGYTEIQKHHLV